MYFKIQTDELFGTLPLTVCVYFYASGIHFPSTANNMLVKKKKRCDFDFSTQRQ